MLLPLALALASCNNPIIGSDSNSSDNTNGNEPTNTIKPSSPSNNEGEMVINLLEFNDLHGHLEQDNGKYGISNAAYLVEQIRNEDNLDNTILLAAGDMFQETALARLSYGRVVVDCMSEMGFDMMNLGNHEFDWTLPRVLEYWDGNLDNGEASFPLINTNLYDDNGNLVTISGGNIVPSTIIEREGIKIGLIGLLGNVESSILASMTEGYDMRGKDDQIAAIVEAEGKRLKDNGADIIVVSIHDGDTRRVENYGANKKLAYLKYNDEYLVDAVINGHTHSKVKGAISRADGVAMPVIQSQAYYPDSGNLNCFGRIDLTIDLKTKDVIASESSHISVSKAGNKYNKDVQAIVDSYYNASKEILEESYCYNEVEMSRYSDATKWVSNMMMAYTGANASISNNGGIRGTVPVGQIGFKEIYNFNPFDNEIILMDIRGYDLKSFLDKNSSYYFYGTEDGFIDQNKTYRLAIIDYVFYSKYFQAYKTKEFTNTHLTVRDLMISELRNYKDTGFNVSRDYNNMHNK